MEENKRNSFVESIKVEDKKQEESSLNKKFQRYSARRDAEARDEKRRTRMLKAMDTIEMNEQEEKSDREKEVQEFFKDIKRKTDELIKKQDEESRKKVTSKRKKSTKKSGRGSTIKEAMKKLNDGDEER